MPIRRRRPLGAASRNRSGIENVMSPLPILRLNTRIGGSDSTPTTAPAGPRRCRLRTDPVTRSHRWDVAAPSPEHASLSAVSRDESSRAQLGSSARSRVALVRDHATIARFIGRAAEAGGSGRRRHQAVGQRETGAAVHLSAAAVRRYAADRWRRDILVVLGPRPDRERATLQRVGDAVAASGTDDHIVFLETRAARALAAPQRASVRLIAGARSPRRP
jgi:hypothetical protein